MYKLSSVLLILFFFILCQFLLISPSQWYDEFFTTTLIQGYTISGILEELRFDYHPPLYFIFLKGYSYIFGNEVIVLKYFNLIISAAIGLSLYGFSKKMIDHKFALITVSLFFLFPALYNEIYQIRMYILAPYFLLLTATYGVQFYFESKSLKNQLLFGLFSVLAAYSHYIALVGVGLIQGYILLLFLIYKKKSVGDLFKVSIGCLLIFTPWLPTFITQLNILKDPNWNIGDGFSKKVIKYVMYYFYTGNNVYQSLKLNYALTILLFGSTCATIFLFLKEWLKGKFETNGNVFLSFLAFPAVVLILVLAYTKLVGPIWFPRYLIIFFPIFVLGLAFVLYQISIKYVYIYYIILGLCFVQKFSSIYSVNVNNGFEKFAGMVNNPVKEGEIILDANPYTSTYFKNNKQYLLEEEKFINWNGYHLWNVELVKDYHELSNQKPVLWSTKFKSDSIYIVGKERYKLARSFVYPFVYREKGILMIFEYRIDK